MMEFNWTFVSIALVCVLSAGFVAPYTSASSSFTIGSNSLFVGDKTNNMVPEYVKLVDVQTGGTSNFATDGINGPNGIIFTGGVMLVANQFPNTNLPGDIAKYDSNGMQVGFLVPQSDPNAPHAPRGIVLSPDHSVLDVADFTESIGGSVGGPGKLLKYNANTGAFIASYSAQTLLNGEFKDQFNPRGIVFGPNGLLYISVMDARNPLTGYILTFNPSTSEFNILVRSDAANFYASGLHRPEGIVSSSGNLWVTSFCARDSSTHLCAAGTGNVDKIMEFDSSGNLIPQHTIPLESSTEIPRTFAQAILFGPNGNLYVPITSTGDLRVCDISSLTCTLVPQSGPSHLVQPWYLSFSGTDPSTLAYNPIS
jgi:hypothetical protein